MHNHFTVYVCTKYIVLTSMSFKKRKIIRNKKAEAGAVRYPPGSADPPGRAAASMHQG